MGVAAEELHALHADGPVTQRGAFRRTGDDADVLGHGTCFLTSTRTRFHIPPDESPLERTRLHRRPARHQNTPRSCALWIPLCGGAAGSKPSPPPPGSGRPAPNRQAPPPTSPSRGQPSPRPRTRLAQCRCRRGSPRFALGSWSQAPTAILVALVAQPLAGHLNGAPVRRPGGSLGDVTRRPGGLPRAVRRLLLC